MALLVVASFDNAASSAPPASDGGCSALKAEALLARRNVGRVRCPALQAGPGDLPRAQARALLLDKISAGSAAHRRAAEGTQSSMCIFPGEAGMAPRFVTLLVGSRGVAQSETALGAALDAFLDSRLDDARLRQLVNRLAMKEGGPIYVPPYPTDGSMHASYVGA